MNNYIISCVHCSYIERQLYVFNNEKTVYVHFITLTLSQHQISRIHKSMRNIRYNTCTENMIYVHILLSLRMIYVVYVAHVVSSLTHPQYILNMYTCITPILYGNLFYANAVALFLKMSSCYLTYEYDCYTFKKCFRKETKKINHKNKHPWIIQTLRNEIKERDQLYWIGGKHPTTENKEIYTKF